MIFLSPSEFAQQVVISDAYFIKSPVEKDFWMIIVIGIGDKKYPVCDVDREPLLFDSEFEARLFARRMHIRNNHGANLFPGNKL